MKRSMDIGFDSGLREFAQLDSIATRRIYRKERTRAKNYTNSLCVSYVELITKHCVQFIG